MKISVIIPTYQEEGEIGNCVESVRKQAAAPFLEVIVSDGGSKDRTLKEAELAGTDKIVQASVRGRAPQMNQGSRAAQGDILYFLHADARPPTSFDTAIKAVYEKGYRAGTFRFRFSPMRPWLLWLNGFMTRFSWSFVQGGDRSLFVEHRLFDEIGGYDEYQVAMEDFEILERIRPRTAFRIIPRNVLVSSRKYRCNSYLRVQYANWKALRLYRKGASSHRILQAYQNTLSPNTPGY